MKIPDFIKNPFFWGFILVLIITIIYFTSTKSKPSYTQTCNSNEQQCGEKCFNSDKFMCMDQSLSKICDKNYYCPDPLYPNDTTKGNCCEEKSCNGICCGKDKICLKGKCLSKCSSKEERCGETCYDPQTFMCMDETLSKICDKNYYCPNSLYPNDTTKGTCCPSSDKCINNRCEVCPEDNIVCNGKCCQNKDDKCQDENTCCTDDNWCIANGTNTKICCPENCCNGICCGKDEVCLNGKCLVKCAPKEERCGETCYDPQTFICMDETISKTCDKHYYCPNSLYPYDTTKGTCCPLSNKCINNICEVCPQNNLVCDGKCCTNENDKCQDGHICCNDNNWCFADGTNTKVCCKSKCCNGKCCTNEDDKCQDENTCCSDDNWCIAKGTNTKVCCPEKCCGGICCGKDETCLNGKCGIPCGENLVCDPDNQHCFEDNRDTKNIKYSCITNGCNWGEVDYNPQLIMGKGTVNPPQYPLCKRSDNTYWLLPSVDSSTTWDNSSNTVYTTISGTDYDPVKCTPTSCDEKISSNSVHKIELSEYGVPTTSSKNNGIQCLANLDCNLYLNKNIGKMDEICEANNSRCCKGSDNKYTGQICIPTASCATGRCRCVIPGKKGDNCQYSRENTCNNYGNPDDDGNCTCDIYCKKTPSGGCERILARDFFEANAGYGSGLIYNWFMTFINVNGDIITFKDSSMMQNEVIGWESLFVFQIGNMPYNTVQWTAMKQPGIGKGTTGQGYSTVLPESFPIPGYKGSWKCNIYSSFVNGSTNFVNFMLSNLSGKNICGVSMANIRDSSTLTFNCGTSPLPYKFYEPGTFFNSSPAILIFYGSTYLNGTN